MNFSVEGEETKAVRLVDALGDPVSPAGTADAIWDIFAGNVQTELRGLPSLNNDVTVVHDAAQKASAYRVLVVTFGGTLAGEQYQLDARVVNTSLASAVTYHVEIGETEGEPLVSDVQGWFAGAGLGRRHAKMAAPLRRRAGL